VLWTDNAADRMSQYGIVIGRERGVYHTLEGHEHIAVYAKTGSGKTSSVVIPICLSYPGSLIVLDVKGEVFRRTAGYRSEVLGQDVYVFDPTSKDNRSHRWNPLQAVDRNSIDRFDQVSRAAHMLFPEATGGQNSNADAFWTPSARIAFTAVATLVAETPEMPFTMAEVLRMFSRGDAVEVLRDMVETRRKSSRPNYSRTVVDGLSDYLRGSLEQVDGIRKMTSTRLAPWFNPRVAAATSTSDFDLRQLRRKPMTVYVRVQPGHIARMRTILALLFDAAVNLNTDALPADDPTLRYPALILLDEFIRLGRMDPLAEAAQYAREYELRFLYVIQNIAQLRAKYGPDGAQDILDNVGVEIVFGTNDHNLTKELSERLGDDTIGVETKNRPRFMAALKFDKHSTSEHPHRRPIMLPQEIARLDPNRQIVLRAGMYPMNLERSKYFDDDTFTNRLLPPPEIPVLKVDVELDDGLTKLGQPHPPRGAEKEETAENSQ
jgi:type IV secretion system protein VirD4